MASPEKMVLGLEFLNGFLSNGKHLPEVLLTVPITIPMQIDGFFARFPEKLK